MFKLKVTENRDLVRKDEYEDYLKRRKEEFKQMRILKSIGIKFKINIRTNYKDERVRTFQIHQAECPERYITDISQFPDCIWDYYKTWSNVTFFTISRIKPLLFKTEKEYQVDPHSLKDFVCTAQVRIDHGVIHFDQVDVLEDACTQELQTKLNNEWRILAIIPQPGQRRPDYIIGRNSGI